MNNIDLQPLKNSDFDEIVSAFQQIGWDKPKSLFQQYFDEEREGFRHVLIARDSKQFCGYVTLKWTSDYAAFANQQVPEIVDLNVLPDFRRKGTGTMLVQTCEKIAKERGATDIGLGVGLLADYGPAQRLYVRLGYMPDGNGLHYKNIAIRYGETVTVDDELVIFLTKKLL
jgi:ribosomal protein S18 acetylase RimI-like enzyme